MKKIAILGSTGSIGRQTIDIVRKDKKNFKILLLTANKNYKLLKLCINSKKNIFVEKPGLKTFGEINKIYKLRNKKILMFGYIYLFNNCVKYIRKFAIKQITMRLPHLEKTGRKPEKIKIFC